MSRSNCVLAYSGGLDTSAIVPWLIERDMTVHAVLVNVGQDEDLDALCARALDFGARTAVVRDARPAMFEQVVPQAIALSATYEGTYRLGTALARPFIALEQVRRAREIGGATLVHGATGKGNDQIRFEFAYRALAPQYPVLAPWKVWDFSGRQDLVDYLQRRGFEQTFEVTKEYSLDENLWHLSIEGGALEDAGADLDVHQILDAVSGRFSGGGKDRPQAGSVQIRFEHGIPVAIDGAAMELPTLIAGLNRQFRHAHWAWDLIIENRFTGIKSRGLYINPAAKLLHIAVDSLARSCLNKPTYDLYADLGRQFGAMLYRGEFFSDQRLIIEASAREMMELLSGTVTVRLDPLPYVSRIDAAQAMFCKQLATFEQSDFSHRDAQGYIELSYLNLIGRTQTEGRHANALETSASTASCIPTDQCVSGR